MQHFAPWLYILRWLELQRAPGQVVDSRAKPLHPEGFCAEVQYKAFQAMRCVIKPAHLRVTGSLPIPKVASFEICSVHFVIVQRRDWARRRAYCASCAVSAQPLSFFSDRCVLLPFGNPLLARRVQDSVGLHVPFERPWLGCSCWPNQYVSQLGTAQIGWFPLSACPRARARASMRSCVCMRAYAFMCARAHVCVVRLRACLLPCTSWFVPVCVYVSKPLNSGAPLWF